MVATVVEDRYSIVVGLVMFKCSGGGFRVFCASPLGLAGTDPLGFRVFGSGSLGLAENGSTVLELGVGFVWV